MATVLIADDHPLFRDALRMAVQMAVPEAAILEAGSAAALFEALKHHAPDLLMLDLRMPDSDGLMTLLRARAGHPSLPVLVVSAEEDAAVIARARACGAAGYLKKSAGLMDMTGAIRRALAGEPGIWPATPASVDDAAQRLASLSPTQLRVLQGVLDGRLNKQIAYDLGISEVTVKAHMTAVFRKLGVLNRTQAVLLARDIGLTPPPPLDAPLPGPSAPAQLAS